MINLTIRLFCEIDVFYRDGARACVDNPLSDRCLQFKIPFAITVGISILVAQYGQILNSLIGSHFIIYRNGYNYVLLFVWLAILTWSISGTTSVRESIEATNVALTYQSAAIASVEVLVSSCRKKSESGLCKREQIVLFLLGHIGM